MRVRVRDGQQRVLGLGRGRCRPCHRWLVVGARALASPEVLTHEHTAADRQQDVIRALEPWVAGSIEPLLSPSTTAWQPSDFLPDASSPDFLDELRAVQETCRRLPPEYWLVLVGDMVTEEALPSYMSMLNRMTGTRDESGADDSAWARWNRAWTSEENRHGDLLNKFLHISGQVNMRAVEASVQHLIGSGFDPKLATDPYRCFVYTSFQERATKISHKGTADIAREHGAEQLATICTKIAGDEARHEAAYQKIVDQLITRDTDGAVLAFAHMMRSSIVMPAHLMREDADGPNNELIARKDSQPDETRLFQHFAAIADAHGVYTATDYAQVLSHLMRRWEIQGLSVSSGEAAEAQEWLVDHERRMKRIAEIHEARRARRQKRTSKQTFNSSWLFGRELIVP